jgi:hypothetical protein
MSGAIHKVVSLVSLREYASYSLPRGGHQTPRSVRPGDVLTKRRAAYS